jgi:hypothetical protein
MTKLNLSQRTFITIAVISFAVIYLLSTKPLFYLDVLSIVNKHMILKPSTNDNHENVSGKSLIGYRLISSDWKSIAIDSLVDKSQKFFIFFSPQDCDFCVHQIIYEANQNINKDAAIVIPICQNIRALQFCKTNYKTDFDFYTMCPNDSDWIRNEPTPFIAYVDSNLYVKALQAYDQNDPNKIKLFIDYFVKHLPNNRNIN